LPLAWHLVAGTVRNQDQIAGFEALAPGRATGWLLEVTDDAAVAGVVAARSMRRASSLVRLTPHPVRDRYVPLAEPPPGSR